MNPQDTATFEQNWLKAFQSGVQQPTAQLQETQAAAAAAGASAGLSSTETQTAEVKAQQAQALQGLRGDLQKGLTLRDALSKYTALGMSADNVFKQYLAESPYGTPHENPNDLQQLGVSADALGKIGDPGSFMDKYNTRNAILSIRDAENKFNKIDSGSYLAGIFGFNPAMASYQTAKQVVGDHLSTLIPGAPGGEKTASALFGSLPNELDPRSGSTAEAKFSSLEDQLLKSKGYSTKDIGLTERQAPKKGSDLISNLLQNAGKDITGMVGGVAKEEQTFGGGPGGAAVSTVMGIPGVVKQYTDIATNPVQAFKEHPVSSTLAVLGPILGLKGGPGAADATAADQVETASTAQAAADIFSKAPNKLQQLLTPGKSKNIIGQIRDQVVSNADQTGKTVTGDSIISDFKNWANQAKMASPADSAAIDDAVAQAEKNYAGKTFKPTDLKAIYDKIESGYTVKGIPKSATSANIDRGMQDTLQGQLDQVAPGFGKTTDLFRQTYQAEKSPVRKVAIGAGKTAVGAGLGLAGLDTVRHILGL